MKARVRWVLVAWIAAGPAAAGELETATAAAFSRCLGAEGEGLSDAEAAALGPVLAPLVRVEGVDCAAAPAVCAQRVGTMSCDALAASLESSLGEAAAGLESLPATPPGELPLWAESVGFAMRDAVVRCYTAETGAPPEGPAEGWLDAWGLAYGQGLVQMQARQNCTARPDRAVGCVEALRTMPCERLLGAELSQSALEDWEEGPCDALLDCPEIRIEDEAFQRLE